MSKSRAYSSFVDFQKDCLPSTREQPLNDDPHKLAEEMADMHLQSIREVVREWVKTTKADSAVSSKPKRSKSRQ